MRRKLKSYEIESFAAYLRREERSEGTVSSYLANVHAFAKWLGDGHITKEAVVAWKDELAQHYAPATVNVKLAAVNAFFKFCGWQDCCVKALRLQRRAFRDPGRELTKAEYEKLVMAARDGKDTSGSTYGDDMRHGHPGIRGEVRDRGGSFGWPSRN